MVHFPLHVLKSGHRYQNNACNNISGFIFYLGPLFAFGSELLKDYFVKFMFLGGSALLLSYSVGTMASCNYIPHMYHVSE